MQATDEAIESFFRCDGWEFEKADPGLWILKAPQDPVSFEIFAELSDEFLTMVIPMVENVKEECKENLWHHLLRLNYDTSLVRFGINRKDEVLLTLELPASSLDFGEFQRAIRFMCETANKHYPEIFYLSQNEKAISSLITERVEERPEPASG